VEFIREHADHRQPEADGGLRWGVEPICAVLSEHGLKIAPSTCTSTSLQARRRPSRAGRVTPARLGQGPRLSDEPLSSTVHLQVSIDQVVNWASSEEAHTGAASHH